MTVKVDYLVVGSGIAGLTFARKAAKHGSVALLTKRELSEANTRYAQGGIAAVVDPDDSFQSHIRDTHIAGDGLCHEDVVRLCVESGPRVIKELVQLGVEFSRKEAESEEALGPFDLGREGGHRARRVLHAGDITGAEIERALVEDIRQRDNVQIFEHHIAINLIQNHDIDPTLPRSERRVLGAYALDIKSGEVLTLVARTTVLATGGVGKVYLYTSNPDIASGDGIAMAYRAGARIANMEFIQFHPTCLYHPKAKNFLISEALRGEGGELRLSNGEPFMRRYHEMGSLAPRDIVARAIDAELKRSGEDSVFLDMTHRSRDFIERRFPNIHATCLSFGIDMTSEPIPVVPAAHYSCGGVQVDTNGQSSLAGLLAIGECTCTGLHGANRLASNSLLEGAVYGHRAAQHARTVVDELRSSPWPALPPWDPGHARPSDEGVVIAQNWDEIRRVMSNYVGIVRTVRRLMRARRRLELLVGEIHTYYWDYIITNDLIELRNLATVAQLIIECAMRRRESRGLNYNLDYPTRDDARWQRDTVVDRLMLEGF
jgi:L-aspartate oxidase